MPEQPLLPPDATAVRRAVEAALDEDGARRDLTTRATVPENQRGRAVFLAKASGVLAGMPVVAAVFAALDPSVALEPLIAEAAWFETGAALARVEGPLAPILSGERTALNFLQRLCGIATRTRAMVAAVRGLPARIADTRKTTPGLRELERYAVRAGGGRNHRFNLADGILLKDNHLAAARARGLTIQEVIQAVRLATPHTLRVEVEVTSIDEALEALAGGAEVLLLDNMSLEEMRQVAEVAKGRALVEASGGVTLENVRAIAETGVSIISVGAITHSAPAIDISLEVEPA